MSAEINAYDLGRFQRIVGVDAPNISGNFRVLSLKDERQEHLVWPIEVTLWFDSRRWGRTYISEDFSARVKNGETDFTAKDVRREDKRAEVQELEEELRQVIVAAAAAAVYQDEDPKEARG